MVQPPSFPSPFITVHCKLVCPRKQAAGSCCYVHMLVFVLDKLTRLNTWKPLPIHSSTWTGTWTDMHNNVNTNYAWPHGHIIHFTNPQQCPVKCMHVTFKPLSSLIDLHLSYMYIYFPSFHATMDYRPKFQKGFTGKVCSAFQNIVINPVFG